LEKGRGTPPEGAKAAFNVACSLEGEALGRVLAELGQSACETGPAPPAHDERVEARLCARCSFREADCDFMGKDILARAGSVPCGGYLLLVRLLALGVSGVEGWCDE
jgi:hypothetical protein